MKERIYTIAINEAFGQDTECPLCICERKLENDALEYTLGPAMMEPDGRIRTNRSGFCREHFTRLYNMQQNRLPLALIIDTHMEEQTKGLEGIYKKYESAIRQEVDRSAANSVLDGIRGRKSAAGKAAEELLKKLDALESTCAVCDRVHENMERLIENTLYLYQQEPDFRKKFMESKGLCLRHLKMLLKGVQNGFSAIRRAEFVKELLPLELEALKRVQADVHHFTDMFDYRNQNDDWKNSRDAIPRSIEKLCGPCDLQR